MLTVVIPTIGRSTLNNAIESVLAEGLPCIVVNDGIDLTPPCPQPGLTYVKLGRNFGRLDGRIWYGQIAFTAGVFLSSTEFTMGLGDDDELTPGTGRAIAAAISEHPAVDIWVPGIEYNDGTIVCMDQGKLQCGNVSHLAYRSKIFAQHPMFHHPDDDQPVSDWHHCRRCVEAGATIQWLERICVRIRPHLPNWHGLGGNG